jgi:sensor histidine kinase regulating citrate/malate metabolism
MLLKQDENQKILIHDIKKHLQSIAILNKKGEQQDVSDYIDHMLQSADLQSSARICDNELLNTILCRYMNTCQQKKISFHADIRKGLLDFLDYDDLTALFCNLLDNAVEASSDISGAYIDLSVTYHEAAGFTVITMINSCSKNPFSEKTGKLLSRKKDTLRHGYGMKSVQKIAQKYNGTMQTYYDVNMEFHTIITLK